MYKYYTLVFILIRNNGIELNLQNQTKLTKINLLRDYIFCDIYIININYIFYYH